MDRARKYASVPKSRPLSRMGAGIRLGVPESRPVGQTLAEGVGFEPTETHKTSTVFETVPFVHSGILPGGRLAGSREGGIPQCFLKTLA